MLILIPKIYDIYSTLTNRAGVSGDVFLVSVRVHFDSDLPELFTNCQNFSGNFCGISALKIWRIFLSYSLHILTFSLILKGSISDRTAIHRNDQNEIIDQFI